MSAILQTIYASQPGFHPAQLQAGSVYLRGWFDPRDPSSLTLSGSRVTAIRNKATGALASEISSSGPTLGATLNGGPSLVSTSTSALVSTEAALIATWTGNAPHTVIALLQVTTISATGDFWGCGLSTSTTNDSGGYGHRDILAEPHTHRSFRLGASPATDTTIYVSDDETTSNGATIAAAWRYDGTNQSLRLDEINQTLTLAAGAGTNWSLAPNRVALCNNGRSALSAGFRGAIGPLLIYAGTLSDADCDVATKAIRNWYGLRKP